MKNFNMTRSAMLLSTGSFLLANQMIGAAPAYAEHSIRCHVFR